MDIQAVATSQGLQILKNNLHGKVKQFVLLGDDSTDNGVLDKLLQSNSSTYEQIKESVIFKGEVSKAYFNDQGLLIFELILPYQDDLNKYVYGIGLIDDENTLISITKIPKFNKKRGIGGTFIYKVLISGEPGKVIFSNETRIAFATDEECQKGELRHKAVDSYQLRRATVAEAVKLHNARKINGVNFDGTKDITVKAEAVGGNADTVGGTHAWQMQTLTQKGYSHGDSYLMYCQWNKDLDEKWRIYVADETGKQASIHPFDVKVDYAESANVPIGFVYTQYPGQVNPKVLFGGTWQNISGNYGGLFFRAEGGKSKVFETGTQEDAIRNIKGTITYGHPWNNPVVPPTGVFKSYVINRGFNTNRGGDPRITATFDASQVVPTADEVRPVNTTIRIWKRIA